MTDKAWALEDGVALRKESVDRNKLITLFCQFAIRSLSARRAWIEIKAEQERKVFKKSLSARRAWIEIIDAMILNAPGGSLSARRAWIEIYGEEKIKKGKKCRSPQGERG